MHPFFIGMLITPVAFLFAAIWFWFCDKLRMPLWFAYVGGIILIVTPILVLFGE